MNVTPGGVCTADDRRRLRGQVNGSTTQRADGILDRAGTPPLATYRGHGLAGELQRHGSRQQRRWRIVDDFPGAWRLSAIPENHGEYDVSFPAVPMMRTVGVRFLCTQVSGIAVCVTLVTQRPFLPTYVHAPCRKVTVQLANSVVSPFAWSVSFCGFRLSLGAACCGRPVPPVSPGSGLLRLFRWLLGGSICCRGDGIGNRRSGCE